MPADGCCRHVGSKNHSNVGSEGGSRGPSNHAWYQTALVSAVFASAVPNACSGGDFTAPCSPLQHFIGLRTFSLTPSPSFHCCLLTHKHTKQVLSSPHQPCARGQLPCSLKPFLPSDMALPMSVWQMGTSKGKFLVSRRLPQGDTRQAGSFLSQMLSL